MKTTIFCLAGLGAFWFVMILSDAAQTDKYREGWKDCQFYQLQHTGKNCPIL